MATAVEEPIRGEAEHGQFVIARVQAERSSAWIQITALIAAAACIAAAAALQQPINQQRRDLEIALTSDVYKDLPPIYGLVGAAGGPVRALTSMYLWQRAEELKQEGKYFESHALAKWICILQPRFPTVWANRAWDESYNISVGTHSPRERWQWVYNGIRLLRDEGIPNNDRFAGLYRELSWIWFHKVGDRLDDYHHYYKRIWAANMEILLGAPPTGVSDEQTINWFRPVAEAPRTLAGVQVDHPGVAALVSQLADLGVDVDARTDTNRVNHPLEEQFFRPYTAYLQNQEWSALGGKKQELSPEVARMEEFFTTAPKADLDALVAYLRGKVLREQYKMDPQFMLNMTGKLMTDKPIPIDWRTPFSQAMYWDMYGLDKSRQLTTVKEFDLINADRVLAFSINKLRESGRYIFRLNLEQPMDSYLGMTPDFRYLEAMHKMYLELGRRHAEDGEDVTNKTSDMLKTGHVNFLEEAVVDLYLAGKKDEAAKWLLYLAQTYKELDTGKTKERYLGPLDKFVYSQIADKIDTYNGALSTIQSVLLSSYISLMAGDTNEYADQVRLAEEMYNRYNKDKMDDPNGRRALDPFIQLRANGLLNFIVSEGSYPVYYRAVAWQKEQDEVRRQVYDKLLPAFKKMAEAEQLDMDKAFPMPPGMEQWRKDHPRETTPEDIANQIEQKRRDENRRN